MKKFWPCLLLVLLLSACLEEKKFDLAACRNAWSKNEQAQETYDGAIADGRSGSMLNGLRKKIEITEEFALETCQGKKRWEVE